MRTKKWWVPDKTNKYLVGAILWALFILTLTLTPGKSIPDTDLFNYDKAGHAGIFLVQSFLLSSGLFKSAWPMRQVLWVTLATTFFYGLAIEIGQEFVPDRGMEAMDAAANLAGSLLGLCLFYVSNSFKA